MAQRPTLRDISELAGVSVFAVSQALSGKPGVGEDTRRRVKEIADDLGYLPNAVAASLKGKSTRAIGVLTASGRNQYYSMLVQAIDSVLQKHGYHTVTNDAMRGGTYSAALERQSVEALLQQRVAAVVATYSLSRESLILLERWDVPVIFVDSLPTAGSSRYPFVGTDNYGASKVVAEYFASLKVRKAAIVVFPPEWNTREPRERGFTDTASRLDISVEIVEALNSAESAYAAVMKMCSDRDRDDWPDAIYATNTLLLQGTLRALRDSKAVVPRDVSVLGFDDFDWAELLDPPMTVVDQHIDDIGTTAADIIVDIVENERPQDDRPAARVLVEPHLIIRGSCAPKSPAAVG